MSKRFAIISAVGLVENVAIADDPLEPSWIDLTGVHPQPGPGWSYSNGVFVAPAAPPAPPETRVVTKIAMLTRFTDAEYVGILAASKTDIVVEAWRVKFDASGSIDLGDPRTQSGMALLVAKGLFTQARADKILTDPVQPQERP